MSPLFSEKQLATFFSHHRLPVLRCHPYLFSPEKLTTFFAHHCHFYWFHSGVIAFEGVTPHFFYLFDLVRLQFFLNLPAIFFFGCHPWRVSPGAVAPPPLKLVTPLLENPGYAYTVHPAVSTACISATWWLYNSVCTEWCKLKFILHSNGLSLSATMFDPTGPIHRLRLPRCSPQISTVFTTSCSCSTVVSLFATASSSTF